LAIAHPFQEKTLDDEAAVQNVAEQQDAGDDHEGDQGAVAQVLQVHAHVTFVVVVLKWDDISLKSSFLVESRFYLQSYIRRAGTCTGFFNCLVKPEPN
jgi:hypothetical protein